MQILLDWVSELVNIEDVSLDNLIEKLTLGGFEVEETLELQLNERKAIALDISATANRADSLSIKGISKEIGALLDKPYKNSRYLTNSFDCHELIKNSLQCSDERDDYSTFIAITVENITDFRVPKWINEKLVCSGLQPMNNLLDFQNYILLETGYPFEFYDLNKIRSKLNYSDFNLILTKASASSFLANNQSEYTLNKDILLLKADNVDLSIAGVISHNEVSYTNQTKSLLIEGSIFNSKKIRQQSRVLGLRTDRSARYEKGLNNSYLIEAVYRLISLLKISNPNLICKIHTASQNRKKRLTNISLKYENITEILGPILEYSIDGVNYLLPNQISEYLRRLKFKFLFDETRLIWNVQIPDSRIDDITREIDLIEEIGRLHGFNNFVTNLPKIHTIGIEDFSYQARKKITSCFLSEGFNELIQYSLVSDQLTDKNTVKLVNPLLSDCSSLRSSLLPNLVNTVSENLKQGHLILEGFEYGHVFSGNIKSNCIESEQISGIFGGIKLKTHWSELPKYLSWFEGKGKIEEIFRKLNILIYWKNAISKTYEPILHPYRTAQLCLMNGEILGVFGQIHPILAKQKSISSELYLFEFNFELLKNELLNTKLPFYQRYSLYPTIIKDLSFIVDRTVSFDKIQETILENGTKFLVQSKLLDEYRGASIPEEKTSLCIQLTFQSTKKTLINKEIEDIMNHLQSVLVERYNVMARI